MKVQLVFVGRTRNPHFDRLTQDYLERIQRFLPCAIREIKEIHCRGMRRPSNGGTEEDRLLLAVLEDSPCSVLLDVEGQKVDSEEIAAFFKKQINHGLRRIDFLAGGPWGWSESVRSKAHNHWSLSGLTLPHEMARVILLEQIFRALARLNHFPYDK